MMWDSEVVDIEVARYAIRTFRIESDGTIESISQGAGHWKNGVCKAECLVKLPIYGPPKPTGGATPKDGRRKFVGYTVNTHLAPQLRCCCGVYGALSLQTLRTNYPAMASKVVAVMAAEGSTIIGPRGLRTQFARIVAWWSPIRDTATKKICAPNFPDAKRFMLLDNMLRAYRIPMRQEISEKEIGMKWKGGYWA